jgi:hypothetical protein
MQVRTMTTVSGQTPSRAFAVFPVPCALAQTLRSRPLLIASLTASNVTPALSATIAQARSMQWVSWQGSSPLQARPKEYSYV